MPMLTIPDWTAEGILPPIRPSEDPTSKERSPYSCSLVELIERFATTAKRCEILNGFLEYRAFLRDLGIIEGFQWVDGSFTEDKERLKKAAPNDVDVVTFFKAPRTLTPESLSSDQLKWMFQPMEAKKRFLVDAHIQQLGQPLDDNGVKTISYWHGLWGHTRDLKWKGFLQIPLKATADTVEQTLLAGMLTEIQSRL